VQSDNTRATAVDDDPFVGDASLAQHWDDLSLKGTLVAARKRYILAKSGEAGLQQVQRKLSPELASTLVEPPPPSLWLPMNTMVEIDRAIDEVVMQDGFAQWIDFGGESARYDLNKFYKNIMRLAGQSFVVRGLPVAFKMYFSKGKLDISEISDGRCIINLQDVVLPRYFCAGGIVGWALAFLEEARSARPHAKHVGCMHQGDSHCTYELRW